LSIAKYFLIDNGNKDTLLKTLRDRFRNDREKIELSENLVPKANFKKNRKGERIVALIPYKRGNVEYTIKIYNKNKIRYVQKKDTDWGVFDEYGRFRDFGGYGIQVLQKGANKGKARDVKGEGASQSNPVIEKLIEDGRLTEVYLDGENLKAQKIRWVDNYVTGKTPTDIYFCKEIDVDRLFSKGEKDNLTKWIREHQVRGSPIKFRVVFDEPALEWRNTTDRSNMVHAGYKDQCIYIGLFFLKYLMADAADRVELRTDLLERDEIQHLLDPENVDEVHKGEAYERRVAKVGEKINLLMAISKVRKNQAYLWDDEFKPLHDRAEEMFRDTKLITEDSARELAEDYEKYLKATEKDLLTKESLGLKENEVIVYDSMEYAVTHKLPFFAGGLGALAGDHTRAASDLMPQNTLIGIGAFYRLGYLTQRLNMNTNWQEEIYQRVRIERYGEIVKDEKGQDIVIELPMPDGNTIYAKAWQVQAGRTALYFLTTNISENDANPSYRNFLDLTYDANEEVRITQEYVVGVGGERLLERLGLKSKMLHLNEGHVAFSILEKARQLLMRKIELLNEKKGLHYKIETLANVPLERREKHGLTFPQAMEAVRHMVGFTSHTPIAAGNQKFQYQVAEKYLNAYLNTFGASFSDIAFEPIVHDGMFDMTEFAISYSNFFNAVSRKHAEVCREMYEDSNKKAEEKLGRKRPVATNITNAVNRKFYQPEEMEKLLEETLLGLKSTKMIKDNVTLDNISREDAQKLVSAISGEELERVSQAMIKNGIRELEAIRSEQSSSGARILPKFGEEEVKLDPDAFIMIFGRRMAEYKRPNFVFESVPVTEGDIEAWRAVVRDARKMGKKAQIVFMGKAHRTDDKGKRVIQKILHLAKYDEELKGTIVFIEDYNTQVAQAVIKLATTALNNPIPPMEASGTSGMKFLLAGKPSVTVMDGWPLEADLGVYPFVTPSELRDILVGGWRFRNHAGDEVKGQDVEGHVLSQEDERHNGNVIYECLDPECRHVWSVKADGTRPTVCEKCKREAIKNNSYHEMGLMDIYFNNRTRWQEIMRESLVEGLSYFTSHRMFKEYTERMYKPTMEAATRAEEEFLKINNDKGNVSGAFDAIYSSELRDKTDISVARDFMPKRPFGRTTAYTEIRMLKAIGILQEGTKPHTYKLRSEIRDLSPSEIEEILNIPELDDPEIPEDKIPQVKAKIDMIILHHMNLKLLPPVEDGKTLWHVIPEGLIPHSIRSQFINMVSNINKDYPDLREKVVVVTNRQDLYDKVNELASDPYNIVDVAVQAKKDLAKLPPRVKALVFKGRLSDFRQLEGIIAALRALQQNNGQALIRLYEILTGTQFKGDESAIIDNIEHPEILASIIIFNLKPIEIRNYEDLRKMNKNLLKLIQAA